MNFAVITIYCTSSKEYSEMVALVQEKKLMNVNLFLASTPEIEEVLPVKKIHPQNHLIFGQIAIRRIDPSRK